jgi:hypothetical protein
VFQDLLDGDGAMEVGNDLELPPALALVLVFAAWWPAGWISTIPKRTVAMVFVVAEVVLVFSRGTRSASTAGRRRRCWVSSFRRAPPAKKGAALTNGDELKKGSRQPPQARPSKPEQPPPKPAPKKR